jgi:hypothetical protein
VQRQATGARTPEELETLFEDAFLLRDRTALARLFEDRAMLIVIADAGHQEARGEAQIVRLAAALWERDYTHLADPRRVLQTGDAALVVGGRGINVVRRGGDGRWLYAISLLDSTPTSGGLRW